MTARRDHLDYLEDSAALSSFFYPNYIAPLEALTALQDAGIRAVLGGAHGLGGWRQSPRAAAETVVCVSASNYHKALRALLAAFPRLRRENGSDSTTLRAPEGFRISLPRRLRPRLKTVLVKTHAIRADRRNYYVPSLETALCLVFAEMSCLPWSDPEKYMAGADFLRILNSNPTVDSKELATLGEQVYNGGGADLPELVRRIRAGERLHPLMEVRTCC